MKLPERLFTENRLNDMLVNLLLCVVAETAGLSGISDSSHGVARGSSTVEG